MPQWFEDDPYAPRKPQWFEDSAQQSPDVPDFQQQIYQPQFQQNPGLSPLTQWARQPRLSGLIAALIANKQNTEAAQAEEHNRQEEFKAQNSMRQAALMNQWKQEQARNKEDARWHDIQANYIGHTDFRPPSPQNMPGEAKAWMDANPGKTYNDYLDFDQKRRIGIAVASRPSAASAPQGAPETLTTDDGRQWRRGAKGEWLPLPDRASAGQKETVVGLNLAKDTADEALKAIQAVDEGHPAEGALGELEDSAKQRGAKFAYSALGITSARSSLIQKVAMLKAMRTGGMLKGVRNQKYIEQIWSHMPDENKDSTRMMREKLTLVSHMIDKAIEEENASVGKGGNLPPGPMNLKPNIGATTGAGGRPPLSAFEK